MLKEIYFAGGCFWGTEHFFSGVEGVVEAVSGYANGHVPAPSYEEVYTDTTGHAETVRIVYDSARVSLRFLTECRLSLIDPLSVNRQGEDVGTRYRTGVYYTDFTDRTVVAAVFRAAAERLGKPLKVELLPLECFYPAEEYHQKYLDKKPDGYCHVSLKAFSYLRLYQDLLHLLEGEDDPVARMAETAALLQERRDFFWTGFYRVRGDVLILGPFQGPVACQRIPFGKGVCGAAWQRAETLVVPDVEQFPGHIACSSLSRSEIVVPLLRDGAVAAVLDIDSKDLATFDATDAFWLEKVAAIV